MINNNIASDRKSHFEAIFISNLSKDTYNSNYRSLKKMAVKTDHHESQKFLNNLDDLKILGYLFLASQFNFVYFSVHEL